MTEPIRYALNPKLVGSHIVDCKPQSGFCPNNCPECFFNRPGAVDAWLRPPTAPLIPDPAVPGMDNSIVRMNSLHDSNLEKELVIETASQYPRKFFNTSINDITGFPGPVVLTVNPFENKGGPYTVPSALGELCKSACDPAYRPLVGKESDLMFVRVRVGSVNRHSVLRLVNYWLAASVHVVLTFTAYHTYDPNSESGDADGWADFIPIYGARAPFYERGVRHINTYWNPTSSFKRGIFLYLLHTVSSDDVPFLLHTCGRIGIDPLNPTFDYCRGCGNCLSLYHYAIARQLAASQKESS